MNKLRGIKLEISWKFLPILIFFFLAGLVLSVLWFPTVSKVKKLEAELLMLGQEEQVLVQIVSTKPKLLAEERSLTQELEKLKNTVPSQYNLSEVLDVFSTLAFLNDVSLKSLEHVPISSVSGKSKGVVPITFELMGNVGIADFLLQLQEMLPTLDITEIELSYFGTNSFHLKGYSDLNIEFLERASLSRWELGKVSETTSSDFQTTSFGLAFSKIANFLNNKVKVLGIVEAGQNSRALLAYEGEKAWYGIGDRIEDAIIRDILFSGVSLYVDGVILNLAVGS